MEVGSFTVCISDRAVFDQSLEQGLSLGDVERLTGIDRSALSKLERGERPNVTCATLGRYAAALGKQIAIGLADANKRPR